MISYAANIIQLFASTIENVILLASFIGQVIVIVALAISSTVITILTSIATFIQIVCEDNAPTFTEDLPEFTNTVINTIVEQFLGVINIVWLVFESIEQKIHETLETINWTVSAVLTIVVEVTVLLKNAIIVVGDALWITITFIPVHLPQLVKAGFLYIFLVTQKHAVNAYLSLLQFTNFLTDVPLQSFIGIISAIVIVRLSIHFGEDILNFTTNTYWYFARKTRYLYYLFNDYFTDSDSRVITRLTGNQGFRARERVTPVRRQVDNNNTDELCVICQERQKCVLILPCRHVCLCTECCLQLYGYQRTCPICRTFIYHSVTIYL